MDQKIRSFLKPSLSRDLWLFVLAVGVIGFSQSIIDSTFNNFLNESFLLTNLQRTLLEIPRETPGFLVVFVGILLLLIGNRRLASVATATTCVGLGLLAIFSAHLHFALIWIFIYSIGQHLFMSLQSGIGMELAKGGKTGKRLGQLVGIGSFAAILGSLVVFLGFKFLHFNFTTSFLLAAIGFGFASFLLFQMKKTPPVSHKTHLHLRKEYGFYYWLCIFFGTRKQIFLTIAPWVLITSFHQNTQTIAILLTIGGIISIVFTPLLGRAIDHLGERTILLWEAGILICVCLAYGYSAQFFSFSIATLILMGCYVIDQLLMSVNMARATYLHKIAKDPNDINSTLMMGVTIDHIFSISIAILCGLLWQKVDYHYIFLIGAGIAAVNFVAVYIKIPKFKR